MDYLNNLTAQLRDLFTGMTPGSRIIAGLLLAVLLVSLLFLAGGIRQTTPGGNGTGGGVYLYGGRVLTSNEQRAVAEAVAKEKLDPDIFEAGKIKVPTNKKIDYIAAIAKAGAIKDHDDALLDYTKNMGVFISPKQMDQQTLMTKALMLGNVLKRFPGISDATVVPNERIDKPKDRWDRVKIVSASVSVWPISDNVMNDELCSAITGTVAGGLGIVDLKSISITDARTGRGYVGSDEGIVNGAKTYLGEQKKHIGLWEKKIREVISYIPGANVSVMVEIEPIERHERMVVEHKPPASAVHTRSQETKFEKTEASRWARPGYHAQMNTPWIGPEAGAGAQGKQSEKTANEEVTNALQGTEHNYIDWPFAPRRVTASIQIPRSYLRNSWLALNKPADGSPAEEPSEDQLRMHETAEIAKVKNGVAKLLQQYRDPTNPDYTEPVEVTVFADMPQEHAPSPTFMETAGQWLSGNWQTLALLLVVFAGLFVLWSVSRPHKPEPIVIYEAPEVSMEQLESQYAPKTPEEEEEIERQRTLTSFDKSMRSLQEEVADLVEENPDAAAAVLRQWIGNVAAAEK